MANASQSPLDRLWHQYGRVFRDFDDLSLARWMAQTLGQLRGHAWRMSHPLVAAYRLAAQAGHDRQIWHKRLANPPPPYLEASCCRAPLLPLLTRDVLESGLLCPHCNGTAVPLEELPESLQRRIRKWADDYGPVHAVAHWDEKEQKKKTYHQAYEDAALQAEKLLARAATEIAPEFADLYPALIWEDQDECLEVRPEDIQTES